MPFSHMNPLTVPSSERNQKWEDVPYEDEEDAYEDEDDEDSGRTSSTNSDHSPSYSFTKVTWPQQPPPPSTATSFSGTPPSVSFSPGSAAAVASLPPDVVPLRRRRAKRSEMERCASLRADPYAAEVEPYRILCSGCGKWIRLRPNSTYCSIPWDAHRKSCLLKTMTRMDSGLSIRDAKLKTDQLVRKFDIERILCAMCDRWIPVSPTDHNTALATWETHKSSCQIEHVRNGAKNIAPSLTSTTLAAPSTFAGGSDLRAMEPLSYTSAPGPSSMSGSSARTAAAQQRYDALAADSLISVIEPSQVLCKQCGKWVALRKDSSYCYNPWEAHRSKCKPTAPSGNTLMTVDRHEPGGVGSPMLVSSSALPSVSTIQTQKMDRRMSIDSLLT